MYERWSFIIVPCVVVLVILAAVGAALLPTEYGKEAVARLIAIKDLVMELLGVLTVGSWGTMARGHMDERLKQQGDK